MTRWLVDSVFRYGGLLQAAPGDLEPAARQVATSIAAPLLELAQARGQLGDRAGTLAYLRRAVHLTPSPQLQELLQRIESHGLGSVFGPSGDSAPQP